jgi:hypothetical protein
MIETAGFEPAVFFGPARTRRKKKAPSELGAGLTTTNLDFAAGRYGPPTIRKATRRFCCRPSAVALEAMGNSWPYPFAVMGFVTP